MRKIILHNSIIFADNLSYPEALRAIARANRSVAAQYIKFHITRNKNNDNWTLSGLVKEFTKEFMKNPEGFTITAERLSREPE